MTTRPPANSIAAMGFEAWFNHEYAAYTVHGIAPYRRLVTAIDAGVKDGPLAKLFGRDNRQAGAKWRGHVERLRTRGL